MLEVIKLVVQIDETAENLENILVDKIIKNLHESQISIDDIDRIFNKVKRTIYGSVIPYYEEKNSDEEEENAEI